MATTNPVKNEIKDLKAEYHRLTKGKESLLNIIDESELPESVFNSNAIENSTLSTMLLRGVSAPRANMSALAPI